MGTDRYADLHVHVSLKQIVNRLGNIWYTKKYSNLSDKPDRSEAGEYTQADVTSLILGKVDIAVAALFPLEDITDKYVVNRIISQIIFGFDVFKVKKLRKRFPTKYSLLNHERKFIETGPWKSGRLEYEIVKDVLGLSSSNTKIVLSLEGAHGLFGNADPADQIAFENEIIKNLEEVKNCTYPVFMMTLCHFQYNHLAGQSWAIPLPGVSKPALKKVLPLLRAEGKEGINDLGKKVVEKALDTDSGHRILIDTKHASVQTRMWYYDYLEELDENIPVISSHSGVSGIATFREQLENVQNEKANEANRKINGNPVYSKFNPWAINLCDDDIRKVNKLGGMIGISLDERILGASNKSFRKLIKCTLRNAGLPDNKKNWHSALFLENIFHCVKTAGEESMWHMICVSSDNDGIIDPINSCHTARHFPAFEKRLKNIAYPYYLQSDYKGELFISSKNELDNKLRHVFYDNLKKFIVDYFPV